MSDQAEASFRQSVDMMFNRAVSLMDLPPASKKRSGSAIQLTQSGSGSNCAGGCKRSPATDPYIPNIWSPLRAASVTPAT